MSEKRAFSMNKGRFIGKVVVVTGGARGIGKNIAAALCREGAQVIICDINKSISKKTVMELHKHGFRIDSLCVDLSKNGSAQRMINQIFKKWRRLDVLVNNARSGKRLGLLEENGKNWDDSLSVGLKAAFFASQEAIKIMSKNGGSIVNIGSIAAVLACQESPSYHIAKAGLLQLTRYLGVHAGEYGVRVNSVLPGFVVQDEHMERYSGNDNTPYRAVAEYGHPLGRVGKSNDIANVVLFLCSPQASFITGQNIIVDGGLSLNEQSSLIYRFDKER